MTRLQTTTSSASRSQTSVAELACVSPQTFESVPFECGVPFPRGLVSADATLEFVGPTGERLRTQQEVLACWPDGSVKWMLLSAIAGQVPEGRSTWNVHQADRPSPTTPGSGETLELQQHGRELIVATRSGTFAGTATLRCESANRPCRTTWTADEVERTGETLSTKRLSGRVHGLGGCRAILRTTNYAEVGLLRLDVTLHNPNRARHRGGYWDLGDPGSILLTGCEFVVNVSQPDELDVVSWTESPDGAEHFGEFVEFHQESSGGENWDSRTHVDQSGTSPLRYRGCRIASDGTERHADRVSPSVSLVRDRAVLTVAVPEFWECFPTSLEARGNTIRIGFLPTDSKRPHELQAGERITRTIWLSVGRKDLSFAHLPMSIVPTEDTVAAADVVPWFADSTMSAPRLDAYLEQLSEGQSNLTTKREVIDEYGWRNFGEVWADHEQAHFDGEGPVVSHYNNQFDVVHAFLQLWLRTADRRWERLLSPLARHVVDIDLYHTDRDRPAYAGGLFWHTDHYVDAATATHRSYSQRNSDRSPGGGPSCEHNYTTGLLNHYYLTGDPDSRDAVLELADWVIRMDDGTRTPFALLDDGPTGLATSTCNPGYHGPGRGAGNSVNALLDAWLLSGEGRYLEFAEALIRRVVHPNDDVDALDLLNVEHRWSYTVFLASLARYLDLKIEHAQNDGVYAYGVAALLRYAEWMLEHERPYFDTPDQLEYPTEAWAAQEFRKANALRFAARHADGSLRTRLLERARDFSDRAWADLYRFESRYVTRAAVVVINEGLREAYLEHHADVRHPSPIGADEFGAPERFVPQRERFAAAIRTPRGLLRIAGRLLDVRRWPRLLDNLRRHL